MRYVNISICKFGDSVSCLGLYGGLHGQIKRGSVQPGCILGVCGSGVPPYNFLNVCGIFNSRFCPSVSQKRLDLKSLKRQTKAEEEGTPGPFLLSLRLSLKAL